jgi:hypothetical protein
MDGIDAIQKEFKGIQDWDSYAEKMSQIFGITT